MNYEMLSAMRSLLFIGAFLIAVLFLIPKSVKCWRLWKETGKTVHLSGAVSTGVIAFFLLAADFLTFMIVVAGGFNG
jgi:hypothetical protein